MKRLLARYRSLRLGVKLPLTTAAIIYFAAFSIMAVVLVPQWLNMEENVKADAEGFVQSAALILTPRLLHADYWHAYEELVKLASHAPAGWRTLVVVLDSDDRIFVSNRPRQYPISQRLGKLSDWPESGTRLLRDQRRLEITAPLMNDEARIGTLLFRASLSRLFSFMGWTILKIAGIATLIAIAGVVVGIVTSRRMSEPIVALRRSLGKLQRRQYADVEEIPVRDHDEIGELALCFNQLVHELRVQAELEKQVSKAERLAAMGRMVATAAHEIHNPLGGVLNSLSTLEKHAYDPEVRRSCLQTMHTGLEQIRHVVDEMLGYSRGNIGNKPYRKQDLDDIMRLLMQEAQKQGISLHSAWDAPDCIDVPAGVFQEIVVNLLMNAIQACARGGRVDVSLGQSNGLAVLEVRDNGCGMPESLRESLFEPFCSTKPDGTGLGLWVVCRIVDELGGLIHVESEAGRGSTFRIEIPQPGQQAKGMQKEAARALG